MEIFVPCVSVGPHGARRKRVRPSDTVRTPRGTRWSGRKKRSTDASSRTGVPTGKSS